MAIELDEEANADNPEGIVNSWLAEEIKKNARCPKNAELVIQSITALTGNRFNPDDIIDIACSPAPTEALAEAIHETAKFLRAGLNTTQVIEIATHARDKRDVSHLLNLAQKYHYSELASDKKRFEQSFALLKSPLATSAPATAGSQASNHLEATIARALT